MLKITLDIYLGRALHPGEDVTLELENVVCPVEAVALEGFDVDVTFRDISHARAWMESDGCDPDEIRGLLRRAVELD